MSYYEEEIPHIKIFTLHSARVTDYPNKTQDTENNQIDNNFFFNILV